MNRIRCFLGADCATFCVVMWAALILLTIATVAFGVAGMIHGPNELPKG